MKTALVACAIGVPAALGVVGCGGGLSSDSVAKVDDTEISKSQFEQMQNLQLLAASQQVTGGKVFASATPKLVSFKAPYTECTNLVKKTLPKDQAAKAQESQIKQYCEGIGKQTKDGAMQTLLQNAIVDKEAEKSKVTAPDAEVSKQTDQLVSQLGGGKKDVAKLTKLTGATTETLRSQAKTSILLGKLQKKIEKDAGKVTDADVQAYYNKNKAQYAQPETRNLHVILTKTEAQADKALKEIKGGSSFASVAKKYSIDQVTKNDGGKLLNVAKGQQEKALEKAAFSTKVGELTGPVKTETGYYVVRVDKSTPAKQIPFAQVKSVLKQQLQQSKPQEAFQKWQERVVKEWKEKTECREGYNNVVFCKNAPKPATTGAEAPAGQ